MNTDLKILKQLKTDDRCDLSFLKRCLIKNIGFLNGFEGGLAIDYWSECDEKRVILGFNELGMWVEANVETDKHNEVREVADRLSKEFEIISEFDGDIKFKKSKDIIVLTLEEDNEFRHSFQLGRKDIDILSSISPDLKWDDIKSEFDVHQLCVNATMTSSKMFEEE